jgi:hypothetical protein
MLKKSASRGGWPGESLVLAQRAVSEDPRWTRAVRDPSGPSEDNVNKQVWMNHLWSLTALFGQGASLGEEAVLADSGHAGEVAAGAGRVRSLAFLSILLGMVLRCQTCRPSKFWYAKLAFPAA